MVVWILSILYLSRSSDYPPGYQPSEDKASKNLLGSATSMYTHTHTHNMYVVLKKDEIAERRHLWTFIHPAAAYEETSYLSKSSLKLVDLVQCVWTNNH